MPDTARRLSLAVCAQAVSCLPLAPGTHVVGYRPIGREVDPAGVLAVAAQGGSRVYVTAPDADPRAISERRWALPLASGWLQGPPCDGETTMILVPGVGFDGHGRRLGRGSGWYDRLLAAYPAALRIGLAFELQLVRAVPADAWDQPMTLVATEARVLHPISHPEKETESW